ncbi:MAG: hypothetical protein P1S59_10710 [bacterium]|nr:hypothetical protein [bacterium]
MGGPVVLTDPFFTKRAAIVPAWSRTTHGDIAFDDDAPVSDQIDPSAISPSRLGNGGYKAICFYDDIGFVPVIDLERKICGIIGSGDGALDDEVVIQQVPGFGSPAGIACHRKGEGRANSDVYSGDRRIEPAVIVTVTFIDTDRTAHQSAFYVKPPVYKILIHENRDVGRHRVAVGPKIGGVDRIREAGVHGTGPCRDNVTVGLDGRGVPITALGRGSARRSLRRRWVPGS